MGNRVQGLPGTLIDVDLRCIDYANTSLFGTKPIDGGLGWRSVFAVALGGQYQATERFTVRAGYLYNTNPIPAPPTFFNVQVPGIIQNTFTLGASYLVNDNVTLSLAWMHGFRNAIAGPILQIPGSSVRLDAQTDVLWMGFNVTFGGSKGRGSAISSSSDGLTVPPSANWVAPDSNAPSSSLPPLPGTDSRPANAISSPEPSTMAIPGLASSGSGS
jgi:hypothetical protein